MHAGRIRDTGRVLKTVTVDVSKEPVNLLSRRRGGEFTIESREPSAFPQPDNLHHTSSFLDLLMRNLVTMSGEREGEREREEGREGDWKKQVRRNRRARYRDSPLSSRLLFFHATIFPPLTRWFLSPPLPLTASRSQNVKSRTTFPRRWSGYFRYPMV